MWPSIPLTISASVGLGKRFSSPTAPRIIPGVHHPHCIAPSLRKASCTGCSLPPATRPSMVTIRLPATLPALVMHDFIGCPSTSTVHAAHCPSPQPNLVPVRSRSSRKTLSKDREASASTRLVVPLTFSSVIPGTVPLWRKIGRMAYAQGGDMMDESRTFEALFPGARHTLLAALFAEPHRWWTPDELAGRAGVRPGGILPQLVRLRKSGIVREDRTGACRRFQPVRACPIFAELQAIVTKLTSASGGETILVVEDTAATAQITRILLESWGYSALEAHTPSEALILFDAHAGEIHLVLTDVTMPQMR